MNAMSAESADFWTNDAFEDRLTRTAIALFEHAVNQEDLGDHWSQVDAAVIDRVRKHGVFVPAPDRIVSAEAIDGIDGIPSVGCVSFGQDGLRFAGDDRITSYCRLNYFRKVDRIPRALRMPTFGSLYELVVLQPQDDSPMRASRQYAVLDRRGHVVFCPPHSGFGKPLFDDAGGAVTLSGSIQMQADARHQWTITAANEVSHVAVGAYAESVKSLLYARDLPMTASGRKRPILHVVNAHKRRMREGTEIDVTSFLRGTREIVMGGTRFSVAAPQRLIDELAARRPV